MGRPPIGKTAMTDAERMRRHRLKQRADKRDDPNRDLDQPDYPDARTSTQRWHWSMQNIAGDAIALRAFWTREFGDWRKFKIAPEMLVLARQAAEAWQALVRDLEAAAEAALALEAKPPAKVKKTKPANSALVWRDGGVQFKLGGSGRDYHSFTAPAARGIYRISPRWGPKFAFVGYTVSHQPTILKDERIIKTNVKDIRKAKALARADHDAGSDG
jgi:hypothetical protein